MSLVLTLKPEFLSSYAEKKFSFYQDKTSDRTELMWAGVCLDQFERVQLKRLENNKIKQKNIFFSQPRYNLVIVV